MKLYPVHGISIFFSTDPPREFNLRFFTVMYFLPNGKAITKNYYHNSANIRNALRVPTAIEIESTFLATVPTGIPTHYGGNLRLVTVK